MQNVRTHLLSAVGPASHHPSEMPPDIQTKCHSLPLAIYKHIPWSHLWSSDLLHTPGSHLNDFNFFLFSPSNNRQVAFDQGGSIQGFSMAAEIPEGVGLGESLPPVSGGAEPWVNERRMR